MKILRQIRVQNQLFLVLITLEFFLTLCLISQRMVGTHDTFFRFSLQYYFLNNVIMTGEVPQWIPQITQGTTASWFAVFQGVNGILTNALFLCGKLWRQVNFMTLFSLAMYFDKLLLLCGSWLLCGQYFSSRYTAFFVTASVCLTSVWTSQVYFNFHIYYALPLILYLGHRFLDTGRWRYLCLAGNLYSVQLFGNAAYFIPISTLTIFMYFLLYAAYNFSDIKKLGKAMRWGRPFIMALLCFALQVSFCYLFFKSGYDSQLIQHTLGRAVNGAVTLKKYQDVLRLNDMARWAELFLGMSPQRDFTLYCGIFMVPMIILSLSTQMNRKSWPVALLIFVLFLLSYSEKVSTLFYYVWPLMKYFRGLDLLSALIKVFVCFLGGFGFEAVGNGFAGSKSSQKHIIAGIMSGIVVLLFVSGYLLVVCRSPEPMAVFLKFMNFYKPREFPVIRQIFSNLITAGAIRMLVAALVLLILARRYPIRKGRFLIILILILHASDLFCYALQQDLMRTFTLDFTGNQIHKFQPVKFQARRVTGHSLSSQRAKGLNDRLLKHSVIYWPVDAYLFHEQPGSSFRTDFWQAPLNDLMKALEGQPLGNMTEPSQALQQRALKFPLRMASSKKIAAVTEDKVQFFTRAYFVGDKEKLAELLSDPDYRGDILFISGQSIQAEKGDNLQLWSNQVPLETNERINLGYRVLRFDANHFEIQVNIPGINPAWMSYSDVWHPKWRVMIDGEPARIYKANLAYKAVRLMAGQNKVHFYFYSQLIALLWLILSWNSLFWVIWIGVCLFRTLGQKGDESRMVEQKICVQK